MHLLLQQKYIFLSAFSAGTYSSSSSSHAAFHFDMNKPKSACIQLFCKGPPLIRRMGSGYPWQRRHVQGGPLHPFSNYIMNQDNEIGKMSRPNMCRGVTFADLVSMIPEHLRPSNEAFLRMISESSQKEEPVEVVLDHEVNVSMCCQEFVGFLENFYIPYLSEQPDDFFFGKRTKILLNFSDLIQDLLASNCKNWIDQERDSSYWSSLTTEGKMVRENEAKENRFIGDLVWWRLEFEKCLAGEEFDFSNHTTDWPG